MSVESPYTQIQENSYHRESSGRLGVGSTAGFQYLSISAWPVVEAEHFLSAIIWLKKPSLDQHFSLQGIISNQWGVTSLLEA